MTVVVAGNRSGRRGGTAVLARRRLLSITVTQAIATAAETDEAFTVAKAKVKAIGTATETSAAFTLGQLVFRPRRPQPVVVSAAGRQARDYRTRTGGAQWLTGVIEADEALGASLGTATETDTGQTVAKAKVKAIGTATETDAAVRLGRARTLRLASETDAAFGLGGGVTVAVGTAAETDTATAPTKAKARAIGTATETSAAQAIGHTFARAVGTAVETDAALSLSNSGGVGPRITSTSRRGRLVSGGGR